MAIISDEDGNEIKTVGGSGWGITTTEKHGGCCGISIFGGYPGGEYVSLLLDIFCLLLPRNHQHHLKSATFKSSPSALLKISSY